MHLSPSASPPHKDFVSRLSTEILALIFSLVAARDTSTVPLENCLLDCHNYSPKECLVLRQVCRSWQDVLDPFWYSTLLVQDGKPKDLQTPDEPVASTSKLPTLLASLKNRPHLCNYPRKLLVELNEPSYSGDVLEVIRLLPSVRTVTLSAPQICPASTLLPVLEVIATKEIATFHFHSGPFGSELVEIIRNAFSNVCTLKSLRFSPSQWVYGQALPPPGDERQSTARVTNIRFDDVFMPMWARMYFVHWSARLEEVSMVLYPPYIEVLEQFTLEGILITHQRSLKKIVVHCVGPLFTPKKIPPLQFPDFTCFPGLEELRLPIHSFFLPCGNDEGAENAGILTPQLASSRLAAPSLRTLAIDLSQWNDESDDESDLGLTGWDVFCERGLEWMKELIALVVLEPNTCHPRSRLERIHLIFTRTADDDSWPWEWFEKVAISARCPGIALTYNEPTWPQERMEEWRKRDAELKAKLEDTDTKAVPGSGDMFQPISFFM
ncbi:hypothetical protein FQN51_003811 [Onygenales sp. PD_10]|nr:hypothetical protein FQN51_003811 [Onygenales sp. PD_10]